MITELCSILFVSNQKRYTNKALNSNFFIFSTSIFFYFSSTNIDQSVPDQVTSSTNLSPDVLNEAVENQPIQEAKLRSLQRVGDGSNEGYFIDDRSEININFQKYRMVFVVNKDAVFYKKCALRQARKVSYILLYHYMVLNNLFLFFYYPKTHQKVTKARALKFHKIVQTWCDENVNDVQEKQCVDWFMGKQADQIPNIITIKTQENDLTKTPYTPYNRYKVQHTNS